MPTIKAFLLECRVTESKLYLLIVILSATSLVSLLGTSALVFLDDQLSIWSLWYLVMFHVVGISVVIFLSVILACVTRWTRDDNANHEY